MIFMTKDLNVEKTREEVIKKMTKSMSDLFLVSCSWNEQKKELSINLTPKFPMPLGVYAQLLRVALKAKNEYSFVVETTTTKLVITIKNK
jgi:hypothetical protein